MRGDGMNNPNVIRDWLIIGEIDEENCVTLGEFRGTKAEADAQAIRLADESEHEITQIFIESKGIVRACLNKPTDKEVLA
jgi:hypothetical protein